MHVPWPRLSVATALITIVALAAVGCLSGQAVAPSNESCDGIASEVGGCDPDRPTFAGVTCSEVAHEFGRQLDDRLVSIHDGPESQTASKAVRAGQYTSVAASLANLHLRRLGLIKMCAAPEFVALAEQMFSPELRAHAGELLHDGDPVTYAAWRITLVDLVSIIDLEEDGVPGSPPG